MKPNTAAYASATLSMASLQLRRLIGRCKRGKPKPSGNRSGSIVFDMKDTSQIPAVAEPWFLAFNAKVSLRPIMNPQDLAKAGPSIAKAAKQYGK